LFIRQQTAVINVIRAHLAEFGIVAPVGRKGVEALLDVVANPADKRVPVIARACLAALGAQLCRLKEQILEFDRMIVTWHRSQETSKRLDAIPGVGPVLATALVASIADPKAFRSGRNFSAWIGLVPKLHSSVASPFSPVRYSCELLPAPDDGERPFLGRRVLVSLDRACSPDPARCPRTVSKLRAFFRRLSHCTAGRVVIPVTSRNALSPSGGCPARLTGAGRNWRSVARTIFSDGGLHRLSLPAVGNGSGTAERSLHGGREAFTLPTM
jgi:hypothetical protein